VEFVVANQRVRDVAERSLDRSLIRDESLRMLRFGEVQISTKSTSSEDRLRDLCPIRPNP
jgi:hypothetical protein